MLMGRKASGLVAACAALAMAGAACGREDEPAIDTAAESERSEQAPETMQVSGCIQQSGGEFIVTTTSPDDVEVERRGEPQTSQLEAAARAYRLNGDEDQLEDLLGSRVQVIGTVEERADLPELERPGAADNQNSAENREQNREEPLDIDVSELAELSVQSILSTGQVCGDRGAAAPTSGQ
jgi:hypothetical protein